MIGKCKADFEDSEGHDCKKYVDEKWCTPNGGYGEIWDLGEIGEKFSDFQKDGYDARACPECGCKGRKTNN